MAHLHSDGNYYLHPEFPTGKNKRYSSHTPCESCGSVSSRFSYNHECCVCARKQALAFYRFLSGFENPLQVAVGEPPLKPDMDKWNAPHGMYLLEPELYTLVSDPCDKAGHVGLRYRDTGRCVTCRIESLTAKAGKDTHSKRNPSKRVQAQQRGEKWYESDDACECGKLLWKYVPNGRIRRCECGR